jgi:tetratricopeptide (TPR) repeat protein
MDSKIESVDEFAIRATESGVASALEALVTRLSREHADSDVWQQVGIGILKSGFTPAAVDFLDIATDRFPRALELRYWRGNALRLLARYVDAERDFRRVLATMPTHRGAAHSLAFMLRENGRLSAATDAIVDAWNSGNNSPVDNIEDLVFLRECGAHSRAHALALDSHRRWPCNADIAALAAEFALAIGEFDIARRCLHSALDRDPRKAASWLRLAYCRRFETLDDPDIGRIRGAWQNRALDAGAHTCVGFALGKALDDLADYAGAAAVLREANAAMAARTSWRPERWQQFVEQQLAGRGLPRVEPVHGFAPVFVIGLPRTGTTLITSLLSRDPRLRDRGELNWIGSMHALLASQDKLYDPEALSKVAALVSAQMRRDDAPATWYLDKNPLNFRYLDLIVALFPQAKIIHCRRQLSDTALSLWMQHFVHEDLGFSYDFSSIATFARGYERLLEHWRKVLPVQVLDLDYEVMVRDTDTTLGRVQAFLGATPIEVASQATSPSVITTASVWQVRQPVYTRSIGRWHQYAPYVPELATFA